MHRVVLPYNNNDNTNNNNNNKNNNRRLFVKSSLYKPNCEFTSYYIIEIGKKLQLQKVENVKS